MYRSIIVDIFLKLFIVSFFFEIQIKAQNNALDFDGSNDYASISSSSSLRISSNITVEAWVKLDTTSGSKVGCFGRRWWSRF